MQLRQDRILSDSRHLADTAQQRARLDMVFAEPTVIVAMVALAACVAVGVLLLRRSRRIEALRQQLHAARDETAATELRLRTAIEAQDRAEASLRQAQRTHVVGQIASGVAHDFNNLLMVLLGNIDLMQQSTALPPAINDRVVRMRATAERAARLTDQLLGFARREPLGPRALDLNAVVRGITDLVESAVSGIVRVNTRLADEPWQVLADPTQIEMVVLNLAINARDAMPNGGALTIETANVSLGAAERPDDPPAGDYAMVLVRDTGIGMAPEVQARACEPFFTTKLAGQGAGLGLAQVHTLARLCGGGVRIDSVIGQGTSVRVYLARAVAEVEPVFASATGMRAGNRRGATVLLVDDDAAVRSATAMVLETVGYTVRQSHSGRAALDLLGADPAIAVLLTDVAMPGMNGAELARRARLERPGLPIVFFSGYADPDAVAGDAIVQRIVRKPFRSSELAAQIEAALAEAGPAAA